MADAHVLCQLGQVHRGAQFSELTGVLPGQQLCLRPRVSRGSPGGCCRVRQDSVPSFSFCAIVLLLPPRGQVGGWVWAV